MRRDRVSLARSHMALEASRLWRSGLAGLKPLEIAEGMRQVAEDIRQRHTKRCPECHKEKS